MPLSYRRIMVDSSPVGLLGLQEIFDECYAQTLYPGDAGLTDKLLSQTRVHNYIPESAKTAYGSALLDAYSRYVAKREGQDAEDDTGYGFWRGYPRESIPWFPSINIDLCNGCNKCLRLCSPKALVSAENNKVTVDDPFLCVVGCSSCATICKPGAISFPPRSMLDAYPWIKCC